MKSKGIASFRKRMMRINLFLLSGNTAKKEIVFIVKVNTRGDIFSLNNYTVIGPKAAISRASIDIRVPTGIDPKLSVNIILMKGIGG